MGCLRDGVLDVLCVVLLHRVEAHLLRDEQSHPPVDHLETSQAKANECDQHEGSSQEQSLRQNSGSSDQQVSFAAIMRVHIRDLQALMPLHECLHMSVCKYACICIRNI